RHREAVCFRADFFPLRSRQRDALIAVHLPALASKTGCRIAALHPLGLVLVEVSSPSLVVSDPFRPRTERRRAPLSHRPTLEQRSAGFGLLREKAASRMVPTLIEGVGAGLDRAQVHV